MRRRRWPLLGAELVLAGSVLSTLGSSPSARQDRSQGAGARAPARRPATLRCLESSARPLGPVSVTPPNASGPTPVRIGLYVIEITDVDASNNTFRLEAFMDLVWCDPREALEATTEGGQPRIFLEEEAKAKLRQMWWPDVDLVNEVAPRAIENEELTVLSDGTIEYREKFTAALAATFDLRRFPFDTQVLTVEIESFAWPSDKLRFEVEQRLVGFSTEFSIPEWRLIEVKEHVEVKQEVRDRLPFSELVAEIVVERDPGFYLVKIVLPLATMVAISWVVFWMVAMPLSDRMGVSIAAVLTAVAYQFIVSETLPRHAYNNFLDSFILVSFGMMVLAIVENVIVSTQVRDLSRAARLDRLCRWVFPLVYLVMVSAVAVFYLV